MNPTIYDVYQFFYHLGKYGEHKKIATYNNKSDAVRRVERIWSNGHTGSYKLREVAQ